MEHSMKNNTLELIRKTSEGKTVVILLYNLRSCKPYHVPRKAYEIKIRPVFLLSYFARLKSN